MYEDMGGQAGIVQKSFLNWYSNKHHREPSCEFTLKILTLSSWPDIKTCIPVPVYLQWLTKEFEIYYNEKHNMNRQLDWVLSQGTVELSGEFSGKVFKFAMTPIQLILVKYIEAKGPTSLEEIAD